MENQKIPDLLLTVAKRLDVQLTILNDLYYIGDLTQQDNALLVKRVGKLSKDELDQTLKVIISDSGRSVSFSDGYIVISDTVDVINKVNILIDSLLSEIPSQWIVQYYIIQEDSGIDNNIGFDTVDSVVLASKLTNISLNFDFDADLKSSFFAELNKNGSKIISKPVMQLLDGKEGIISQTRVTPLPLKTVSDQGTVTTSGFSEVKTGTEIKTTLREFNKDSATLKYDLKFGEVIGYVEGNPEKIERILSGETMVNSGGVYLLGSLQNNIDSQNSKIGFSLNIKKLINESILKVFCSVQRVYSVY